MLSTMVGRLLTGSSRVPSIDADLRSERLCDDQCHPSGPKTLTLGLFSGGGKEGRWTPIRTASFFAERRNGSLGFGALTPDVVGHYATGEAVQKKKAGQEAIPLERAHSIEHRSVRRRLLRVIDHQNFNGTLGGFQLQP